MFPDRKCSLCTAQDKATYGCRTPVRQPHPFNRDPPEFTCPLTYFRDNPGAEAEAFTLHMHWKRGILPAPGGLDDQAAGYQAMIVATEHGVNAGQSRKHDIAMQQADRKNRRGSAHKSAASRSTSR